MQARAGFRCGRSRLSGWLPAPRCREVEEPTRWPSIRTSVWLVLAPRKNTPLVDAGPPFMTISTPGDAPQKLGEALRAGAGDLFGADHRDVGGELRRRLRPARRGDHQRIQRQRAGVLLRWGNTGEAREDNRGQQISGRERQTRHHFLRNAVRPRTAVGGRQRGENVRAKAPATSGIRPDIASPRCVSVRKPCANVRHSGAGRSPGWSVCERQSRLAPDGPPSHARRAQWHSRTARTDLPLRGQRRLCRMSMRRTGFPFHPRRQTGAADTCCGRVYRSAVTDGLRFPGLLYSSALRIQPKTPDRYP